MINLALVIFFFPPIANLEKITSCSVIQQIKKVWPNDKINFSGLFLLYVLSG